MNPGADNEHDAWLREALRHAPDAQLVAPPSLSEHILREAHAKARGGAASPPRGTFAALWAWLARPPVTAGFASVMVATMVGLMWWDRAPQEEPVSQVAPPQSAPADAAATADTALKRRARDATPTAGVASPRPKTTAPAAVSEAPPAAPAPARAPTAQRMPAPSVADQGAAAQSSASLRSFAERAPAVASVTPADTALATLRRSLADEPHWTWQRSGPSEHPMTEALHAWFARLEAASAGRWQPATPDPATELQIAVAADPELRLSLDGRVGHRFRIDGRTVRWEATAGESAAPRLRQAHLSEAAAQSLRTALEQAAP
jgi:hypothetical protein